jgi:CRISPR-associated exonuclease Cas4
MQAQGLNDILYDYLSRVDPALGDRSTYVGASDVGGCPRRVVLGKRNPPEFDLQTLIRFMRGHLVENIMQAACAWKKIKFEHQLEIIHPRLPYRAHLDFSFANREEIGVLEVKSVSHIPDEPYEGWVAQLYFQLGLVHKRFRKRVRGAIFAMDLNSGLSRLYNGYAGDDGVYSGLLRKAHHIWSAMQGQVEPKTEKGPLCIFCHFRQGCTAFPLNEKIPTMPIDDQVGEYLGLKEQESQIKAEIWSLRKVLLKAVESGGMDEKKIRVGEHIVSMRSKSRTAVDSDHLKMEHPDLFEKFRKISSWEEIIID